MADHRRSLAAERRKASKLRSRIISHGKQGSKAPRLRKAYERSKAKIASLARQVRRERAAAGPAKAIREAERFLGQWESAGPNRAPWLDPLEAEFGFRGAPYCGIGVGHCLRVAGVPGISSRVAAVAFIEDDARAGSNGFAKLVPHDQAEAGDAAIMFGRGVHVELVVRRYSWGLETSVFNTSPEGASGSQSNGGGVYRRKRPWSYVYAVASPAYRS
jgi:hypothetical protein